jgi:glutathione S-transferase
MIFYNTPDPAPNPRRVRMFAAEKGITLETRDISLIAREHRSAAYLAINPRGQTPALQLDDGTVITESVSICRYLEARHPDPPLFGTTPVESAYIDMWIRRAEFMLFMPVGAVWVHTHPLTAAVVPERFTDYGESNRPRAIAGMKMCDEALTRTAYLASDAFSAADIILLSIIDFAQFIGIAIPEEMDHLRDWHGRVSARASAAA